MRGKKNRPVHLGRLAVQLRDRHFRRRSGIRDWNLEFESDERKTFTELFLRKGVLGVLRAGLNVLTSNSRSNSYLRSSWMYQHFPNHLQRRSLYLFNLHGIFSSFVPSALLTETVSITFSDIFGQNTTVFLLINPVSFCTSCLFYSTH